MLQTKRLLARNSLKNMIARSWHAIHLTLFIVAITLQGRSIPGTFLTIEQGFGIFSVIFALSISVLTHRLDRSQEGGGLINRFDGLRSKFNTESSFASMALTKQSVIVAIVLGLIAYVAVRNGDEQLTSYDAWLVKFELGALGIALFSSLVSVLCYDYTHRFGWGKYYKQDLLRKALALDILSWYSLCFALVLCVGNIEPFGMILSSWFLGTLIVYYYFPTDYLVTRYEVVDSIEHVISETGNLTLESVRMSGTFTSKKGKSGILLPYNSTWIAELTQKDDDPKRADKHLQIAVGPLHDLASREELNMEVKNKLGL